MLDHGWYKFLVSAKLHPITQFNVNWSGGGMQGDAAKDYLDFYDLSGDRSVEGKHIAVVAFKQVTFFPIQGVLGKPYTLRQ